MNEQQLKSTNIAGILSTTEQHRIIMQEPSISASFPSIVDFEECASNVIRIDDYNYRSVIDWFKACLQLSQNLPFANRDDYELKVIGNVKNTLSNFFQRTELSLSTLIGLERDVTAMFRELGPPLAAQYKLSSASSNESDEAGCDPSDPCTDDSGDDEMGDAIGLLYKRLLWVAITSVILLILLMIVLAGMCWLRKYIERDMKEIFIACPSREELRDMGSQATARKSVHSILTKRKTTAESKKTPGSAGGEEAEFPEYDDEQYLQDYGDNDPAYAYPMRVWLTPLNRKRQQTKQGKIVVKKLEQRTQN